MMFKIYFECAQSHMVVERFNPKFSDLFFGIRSRDEIVVASRKRLMGRAASAVVRSRLGLTRQS